MVWIPRRRTGRYFWITAGKPGRTTWCPMFRWLRRHIRRIGIFGVEVEFHPLPENGTDKPVAPAPPAKPPAEASSPASKVTATPRRAAEELRVVDGVPSAWGELLRGIQSQKKNDYYMPVTLLVTIRYLDRYSDGYHTAVGLPCETLERWFSEEMGRYAGQPTNTFHYPVWALRNLRAWTLQPDTMVRPKSAKEARKYTLVLAPDLWSELRDSEARRAITSALRRMIPAS